MNLKYYLGVLLTIPLLPILYYQGKKVKTTMPQLPEASGSEGRTMMNSTRNFHMVGIGESTIAGVGVENHKDGFIGSLAKELSAKMDTVVHWKIYAKSGYTAIHIKDKIVPDILDQAIDLIVVGVGANDAFTLNTPKKWKKHVKGLVLSIKQKFGDVPVVFINMPPIKEFPAFSSLMKLIVGNLVEMFGDVLKRLVSTYPGVYYYDRIMSIDDWMNRLKIVADHSDFFSDGVHPSMLTYQVWAKDFANFIYEHDELRNKLRQQQALKHV